MPGAELACAWGGGLVWVGCAAGAPVREALQGRGHATMLKGEGRAWGAEAAGVARLAAGVKAQFDPRGVFNPGGMV